MSSRLRIGLLPLGLLAIATISGTWYKLVSEHVPDPYLVSLGEVQ
jgi:alpha-1,2-glucosyltransferase